jgi:hypothetical protein
MRIENFRERLGRAIQVLRVDLANGHDFSSAVEIIARALGLDGCEHDVFRKVAMEMRLDKIPMTMPPRLKMSSESARRRRLTTSSESGSAVARRQQRGN